MKNIVIEKLTIQNFRNIENEVYELPEFRVAISGVNRIGKSNTLAALYWLLTGYLPQDKASDLESIKTLTDTSLEVSVSAVVSTSDATAIHLTKTYKENWVKTRGTDEITLQGHEINYSINNMRVGTEREWKSRISDLFGLGDFKSNTKIDLIRLFLDVYYLGRLSSDIDWKEVRAFLIELGGNVTDEQVLKSDSKFELIADVIKSALGRIDTASKNLNANIIQVKQQELGREAVIQHLEETKRPSDSEITVANAGIEKVDEKIRLLNSGNSYQTLLDNVNAKITAKKLEISEQFQKEVREQSQASSVGNNAKLIELTNVLNDTNAAISETEKELHLCTYEIIRNDEEVTICKERTSNLIAKMDASYDYIEGIDKIVDKHCPTCDSPLSEEKISAAKKELLKNKEDELLKLRSENSECLAKVKQLSEANIARQTQASELEQDLSNQKSIREQLSNELKSVQESMNETRSDSISESTALSNLRVELITLEEERGRLSVEKNNALSLIADEVQVLELEKTRFKEVLFRLNYYNKCREDLEKEEATLSTMQKNRTKMEQQALLLKDFMKVKLAMLDNNMSKVFGEKVRWLLIRENIKAGSWDEVCKPYVIGKDTLYENGSGSEKIITGLAIIEAIRAFLGVPNLPVLFDEGEALDSDTLANLDTRSQVITSMVNDNFKEVTIVNIK